MSRWWRAYDDALNDPKVQRLPLHLFKTWFNLLCIASKNSGVLPPIADLSYMLRRRPDDVGRDVAALCARRLFDAVDGKVAPHNWDSRQYKSDLSTQRVKDHRKRSSNVSSNVSETVNETPPETETETETEQKDIGLRPNDVSHDVLDDYPKGYQELFWEQYPRKIGRKSTFTKLRLIRKSGEVTFARLMAGVAKIPIGEPKFTPHPITWLNQGRWDDEISTELPLNGAKNGTLTPSERAYQFAERAREYECAEGLGRSPDAVGSDEPSGRLIEPIPKH